jgi:hypothetical protein
MKIPNAVQVASPWLLVVALQRPCPQMENRTVRVADGEARGSARPQRHWSLAEAIGALLRERDRLTGRRLNPPDRVVPLVGEPERPVGTGGDPLREADRGVGVGALRSICARNGCEGEVRYLTPTGRAPETAEPGSSAAVVARDGPDPVFGCMGRPGGSALAPGAARALTWSSLDLVDPGEAPSSTGPEPVNPSRSH